MNEVAQTNDTSQLDSLRTGLQNVSQAIPANANDVYMKMGTDGVWEFGAEHLEVVEGSQWAVNPMSIQHGFVCWTNYPDEDNKKNELLGEVYAPMLDAPINKATLAQYEYPWKAAALIRLKCVSGPDEGLEVVFKPSSAGGLGCISVLIDALKARLDKSTMFIVPVVELSSSTYDHKKWGKTYVPVFKLMDWIDINGPVKETPPQVAQTPAAVPASEHVAVPATAVAETPVAVAEEPPKAATRTRTRRAR